MLRAAASSLLGSAALTAAARQLAPAAACAAFGGAGARTLTAQAAPVDAHHPSSSEEELAEFREGVRTFAQDFVAPHAAEIDRLNGYPSGFEFWRQAGEWGLHGAALVACCAECCFCSCPLQCPAMPLLAAWLLRRPCVPVDSSCATMNTLPAPHWGAVDRAEFSMHASCAAGVTVPTEHGGLGLGYLHHCIAMEELSRASGSGAGGCCKQTLRAGVLGLQMPCSRAADAGCICWQSSC